MTSATLTESPTATTVRDLLDQLVQLSRDVSGSTEVLRARLEIVRQIERLQRRF